MYSRISNPTVECLENKIAALEGGVGALCTSSGQSATLIAILNICKSWRPCSFFKHNIWWNL